MMLLRNSRRMVSRTSSGAARSVSAAIELRRRLFCRRGATCSLRERQYACVHQTLEAPTRAGVFSPWSSADPSSLAVTCWLAPVGPVRIVRRSLRRLARIGLPPTLLGPLVFTDVRKRRCMSALHQGADIWHVRTSVMCQSRTSAKRPPKPQSSESITILMLIEPAKT